MLLYFMVTVTGALSVVDAQITKGNFDFEEHPCGQIPLREKILTRPHPKILGGYFALYGMTPYMVAFKVNGGTRCGAMLILNQWAITTTHCYKPDDESKDVTVTLGDLRRETPDEFEKTVEVIGVIRYPLVKQRHWIGNDHDVMLLKLKHRVEYTDYIQPICIAKPSMGLLVNVNVTFPGWGKTRTKTGSENLKVGDSFIITNAKCSAVYGKILADYWICAEGWQKKSHLDLDGICLGDSGGPLVFDYGGRMFSAGTLGLGGCEGPHPAAYARLSSYYQWIKESIENESQWIQMVNCSVKTTTLLCYIIHILT